jgi:NhaA family Na+:H+ antiporter
LRRVERAAREGQSPLERLEHALHPWVSFGIMPLFALANAGVVVQWADLFDPVAVAVMLGLCVGKPLGIALACALAVGLGLVRLPRDVSWGAIIGGGFLAGIGFTMALFIAGLALEEAALDAAKIGVLVGSVISAVVGAVVLLVVLPAPGANAGSSAGTPPPR